MDFYPLQGKYYQELINMNSTRISLIIVILVISFTAMSPVWAKKDLPAINDEGMELVKNSNLATVYADPGADLSVYNRVMLLDATVAFKKNWKRDQNRYGNSMKVKDRDMVKIQEEVAATFREVFTKELVDSGYAMADEPGEDVLLVKSAIVDLDVTAPDIQTSSLTSEKGVIKVPTGPGLGAEIDPDFIEKHEVVKG